MSTLSEAFREFVYAQPTNRRLEHWECWSRCAVGEFLVETGRVEPQKGKLFVVDDTEETAGSLHLLVDTGVIIPEYYTVHQVVANDTLVKLLVDPVISDTLFPTYGHLQNYLTENE